MPATLSTLSSLQALDPVKSMWAWTMPMQQLWLDERLPLWRKAVCDKKTPQWLEGVTAQFCDAFSTPNSEEHKTRGVSLYPLLLDNY